MTRRLFRLLVLGALLGLAAGLYYGWVVRPAGPIAGELASLRQDYKDDYILMVAEAYDADGDLLQVEARLRALGIDEAGPAVAGLAERFINSGQAEADIRRLATLAAALGHTTPAIAPYLE